LTSLNLRLFFLPSPFGRGAGGEGRRIANEPRDWFLLKITRRATTLTPALSRREREEEGIKNPRSHLIFRRAPFAGIRTLPGLEGFEFGDQSPRTTIR
jgi:hypothetical protein